MTVVTLQPGSSGSARFDANSPPAEGRWDVRVWSPDKTSYHRDGRATVIPHADGGDISLGFEVGSGVVQVDANPNSGDGGIPVDMSKISAAKSRQAYEAAQRMGGSKSDRIKNAFRMLSGGVAEEIHHTPAPLGNPLVPPDTYVTPDASLDGRQIYQGETMPNHMPPPRVGQVAQPPQAAPQPVQHQPTVRNDMPAYAPSAAATSDPLISMLIQQQYAQQHQMQQIIATMTSVLDSVANQNRPPAVPYPSEKQADAVRTPVSETQLPVDDGSWLQREQPLEPVEQPSDHTPVGSAERTYTRAQVMDVVSQSFKTLGIPNLGPAPTKPTYLIEYDMGKLGRLTARYHWVGVHGKGLFLVYDRRYEHGTEYVPPDMGPDPFTVNCPDHSKSFRVKNPGFVHPFGKLLIINLVIVEKEDAGQLSVDEDVPEQLSSGMSTETNLHESVTLEQMLEGTLRVTA